MTAGPLAFPWLKDEATVPARDFRPRRQGFDAIKQLAVVNAGAVVTVSIPAFERQHVALLYDGSAFRDSGFYSLAEGEQAVTFEACRKGKSPYDHVGPTQYAGGFIVDRARCVALDVRVGTGKPSRVWTSFGSGEGCPRLGGYGLMSPVPGLTGLQTGSGVIYGVRSLGGERARIVRFDARTGSTGRSVPFRGGFGLALAGGSLWASPKTYVRDDRARDTLFRFDPGTLALRARVRLPEAPGPLAAGPPGLWAGGQHHLYLLDPADGRILVSVPLPRGAVGLALDPSGRVLYVAAGIRNLSGRFLLQERDARSGAMTASSVAQTFAVTPTSLTPTDNGVWVSGPTGNFGAAEFFPASGLRYSRRFIEGGQGTTAALVTGSLWVNPAGPPPDGHILLCADPRTGRIKRRVDVPKQLAGNSLTSDVVQAGRFLYVGTDRGLVRFSPGVCRS